MDAGAGLSAGAGGAAGRQGPWGTVLSVAFHNYVWLLVCLCLIVSCKQEKQVPVQVKPKPTGYYEQLDVRKWNKEILNLDSLRINDSIPFITKKSVIFKLLGKPSGFFSIGDRHFIYYGKTIFEEIDHQLWPVTIDFESTDLRIVHPRFTMHSRMLPMVLQHAFPESGRLLNGNNGNMWSGSLSVMTSQHYGSLCIFYFQRETLQSMTFYYVR